MNEIQFNIYLFFGKSFLLNYLILNHFSIENVIYVVMPRISEVLSIFLIKLLILSIERRCG